MLENPLGVLIVFGLIMLGMVIYSVLVAWANAYVKRGYITKREYRTIKKWVKEMEKRA